MRRRRLLAVDDDAYRPDVLILDVCMPELDAVELLPVLKEVGSHGRLVFISGADNRVRIAASKLAAARGLKVAANIQKPLDVAMIRALLQGWLQVSSYIERPLARLLQT